MIRHAMNLSGFSEATETKVPKSLSRHAVFIHQSTNRDLLIVLEQNKLKLSRNMANKYTKLDIENLGNAKSCTNLLTE